ncbi:MAG: hypothetical protein ACJASL_004876 [Paraglaciecola sp.]
MLFKPLRSELYDFERSIVLIELNKVLAPAALVQLSFPFETIYSAQRFHDNSCKLLNKVILDSESQDIIVIAGNNEDGLNIEPIVNWQQKYKVYY